jgi:hypothetical protein
VMTRYMWREQASKEIGLMSPFGRWSVDK